MAHGRRRESREGVVGRSLSEVKLYISKTTLEGKANGPAFALCPDGQQISEKLANPHPVTKINVSEQAEKQGEGC